VVVLLSAALAALAQQLKDFSTPTPLPSGSTLIVNFLSWGERSTDEGNPANRLAMRLRALELPGVYVETVGHAKHGDVLSFIKAATGRDTKGRCLAEGCREVRLIFYGSGDGSLDLLKTAHELKPLGLHVALAVQVSSEGACGGVIPANVARAAAICLDTNWARHHQQIRAEVPTQTQILANLRLSSEGRWLDISVATPPQKPVASPDVEMRIDPLMWNHVEDFILEELHRAGIPGAPAPPPH